MRLVVTLDRLVEAGERPIPRETARRRAPQGHDLRLDGVTFSYGRHAEPVVDQVDLLIPQGQHLAMVGPSGAGKSTVAGLLAATHVPDRGKVRLGGVPVGDLDSQTLASHRVLIPQEAYVFAGTIGENLRYLHPAATVTELDTVVDALGLRSVVARIGGYDAAVDPGTLSAGERQLIAVARAHLTPAPVLILDEATCHLDPVAEERVERVLAARGGTLIVVAHRISSALRAQRIVLMDGANMFAGTHGELLANSPLYRDLVGLWDIGQGPMVTDTLVKGTTGRSPL
jgi:ATP-binding cassette subfamily C protein